MGRRRRALGVISVPHLQLIWPMNLFAAIKRQVVDIVGAGGRTRTGTEFLPTDFKSVSACYTPLLRTVTYCNISSNINGFLINDVLWTAIRVDLFCFPQASPESRGSSAALRKRMRN